MFKRNWIIGFGVFIALLVAAYLGITQGLPGGQGQSSNPNEILEQSLAESKPALVFFYSYDCEQCKLMEEPVRKAQVEFTGSITILEVEVNDLRNYNLVRKAGVFAVPTLVFYDKYGEKQLFLGTMEPEKLHDRLIALKEDSTFSK